MAIDGQTKYNGVQEIKELEVQLKLRSNIKDFWNAYRIQGRIFASRNKIED